MAKFSVLKNNIQFKIVLYLNLFILIFHQSITFSVLSQMYYTSWVLFKIFIYPFIFQSGADEKASLFATTEFSNVLKSLVYSKSQTGLGDLINLKHTEGIHDMIMIYVATFNLGLIQMSRFM